ncbi:unnamed protein product [Cunninghamella echinulata]
MLTRGATQSEIAQETGAEITTRGKYYPDANLATEKEPPLYLYVTASDQEALDKAVERLNKLIESATVPSSSHLSEGIRKRPFNHQDDSSDNNSSSSNNNSPTPHSNHNHNNMNNSNVRPPFERPPRKFYDENVDVDIPEGPTYNLRAKIVGPQGAYVKHITNVTGCRIQVRGRGSGFIEHDTGMEADVPLYIHISTPREDMLPKAVQLAKDLVATIKSDVEKQPQTMPYNRGYHQPHHHPNESYNNYSNYDYQGYNASSESPTTSTAPPTNESYSAYDYSQYGYYGQQQYDPSYYSQYYQQPPPPPPPPPSSSSDPPPPATATSSSSSTNSPSETGHTGYNSVPPPPQY